MRPADAEALGGLAASALGPRWALVHRGGSPAALLAGATQRARSPGMMCRRGQLSRPGIATSPAVGLPTRVPAEPHPPPEGSPESPAEVCQATSPCRPTRLPSRWPRFRTVTQGQAPGGHRRLPLLGPPQPHDPLVATQRAPSQLPSPSEPLSTRPGGRDPAGVSTVLPQSPPRCGLLPGPGACRAAPLSALVSASAWNIPSPDTPWFVSAPPRFLLSPHASS